MTVDREALDARVAAILAEALSVPIERVTRHASLTDDLGAESIDFLDIVFRLEAEFGLKIPEAELWKGSFEGTDPAAIQEGLRRLRVTMPEFRWDRLPARVSAADLPRLITPRTIVDYLERRESERLREQEPT
jgi:acyl carrier protein